MTQLHKTMMTLKFNSKLIIRVLVIAYVILLIAHVTVLFLRYQIVPESSFAERLNHFFNFDEEGNFPTYYNSILLFLSAQTFLAIGTHVSSVDRYFKSYWFVLSFVFLFLSIDEFARIHEGFNYYVPKYFSIGGTGIFKFAWIIPYGILAIFFGLYSIKFLKFLKREFLIGYIVCGFLYLLGTIGVEAFGGLLYEQNNDTVTFKYVLFVLTLEESLEMLSLILLLKYNFKFLQSVESEKIVEH